ncbi:DUF3329 domain-containing protein [Liquorilactobacillus nagelii]|jgi:hypothetical protein|uniref:DUF3329 domain-containing protein n=1 Tax=Liquorilactobacillus nagelii TaxID=82688 RepID=UPI00242C4AC3|nr:DUF6056 family protein [Liquorilactobacillus nagelii]MCI1699089.1 DUF6056 family protein [Liquorilactobacillus nagelii]
MVKVRLFKTVKIILLWLICLLTGYFFYHLNKLIGFIGDDFLYHFQYNGEWPATQLKSIHNIWDLLVSVVVHTQTWNGRFVGDFFIQALMQFPKIVFNFANSLVFIVVGLLINLFVVRKFTEISSLSLLLTYLLLGLLIPDFGHTMFWMSGACNYLWMTPIYLAFLWPFRWNIKEHQLQMPRFFIALMIFLGFLSGATNENIGPVVVILAYVSYLANDLNHRQSYKYWGLLAAILGMLIMLLNNSGEALNQKGHSFQFLNILWKTINYSGYLLGLIAILFLISGYLIKKHQFSFKTNDLLLTSLLAFGAAGLSVGALVLSPQLPGRTWYGATIFGIICVVTLLAFLREYLPKLTLTVIIGLNLVCLAVTVPGYLKLTNEFLAAADSFKTEIEIIEANPHKVVKVPGIKGVVTEYNPYKGTAYLESGNRPNEHWENAWMAKYYHSEGVILDLTVPVKHFKRDPLDQLAENFVKKGWSAFNLLLVK